MELTWLHIVYLQLSVRGKNKKEKLETFLRSFSKTTDEILLGSTQKDVDEFFDKEKNFLLDYHSLLKDATLRADKMTKAHKGNKMINYLKQIEA